MLTIGVVLALSPQASAAEAVDSMDTTGECLVNEGTCEGACAINTGTCSEGGTCIVNTGDCSSSCPVNAGTCREPPTCLLLDQTLASAEAAAGTGA